MSVRLSQAELEELAREKYERVCAELLYTTKAAWIRWDELDPDGKAIWMEAIRRSLED